MCTKCCRSFWRTLYAGLESKHQSETNISLIGPSNTCMLCSGTECKFCRHKNDVACRYARMFTESAKKTSLNYKLTAMPSFSAGQ